MIGIYKIENTENGMVYIGKSDDIMRRWEQHIKSLENNSHANARLQKDWNNYKINCFNFSILRTCDKSELLEYERFYINKYFNLTEIYNSQIKTLDNKVFKTINSNIKVPKKYDDCIYKSNNLIMSSYDLTLNEHRIISLCCKKILDLYNENINNFDTEDKLINYIKNNQIEISAQEFKREFNLKGNSMYDLLYKTTIELANKEIIYDTHIEKWLSQVDYIESKSIILLKVNPNIINSLMMTNNIPLSTKLLKIKKSSKNSFRLYEILKSKLQQKKLTLSIEQFKTMLNIDDKYEKISEVIRNILKPSIKLINDESDLCVSYKTVRKGKFIKQIEFTIGKNK